MATRKAINALNNAIRQLEIFAAEPGCDFCIGRGETIKQATEELRDVLPLAEEMKTKIDKLAKRNLASTVEDIRDFREELEVAEPSELIASPKLRERGRGAPAESSRSGSSAIDVELPSPKLFDREFFSNTRDFFRLRGKVRKAVDNVFGEDRDQFSLRGLFETE